MSLEAWGSPQNGLALATDDEIVMCNACCGKGWNDEYHAVAGHYSGGETFRIDCEDCDATGRVWAV